MQTSNPIPSGVQRNRIHGRSIPTGGTKLEIEFPQFVVPVLHGTELFPVVTSLKMQLLEEATGVEPLLLQLEADWLPASEYSCVLNAVLP